MDDNKLRFGVGVLVIAAIGVGIILAFLFGAFPTVLRREYTVLVEFPSAEGISTNTPVLRDGVRIGRVANVDLLEEKGVLLSLALDEKYKLTHRYVPTIGRGSLVTGDAHLEFVQVDNEKLSRIHGGDDFDAASFASTAYDDGSYYQYGQTAEDPFRALYALEDELRSTMTAIREASRSIETTGVSVNELAMKVSTVIEGTDSSIEQVADEAVAALEEFQGAMRDVRSIVGSPELQQNLEQAVTQLPQLLQDAQDTLDSTQQTFATFDRVGEQFEKVGGEAENLVVNINDAVDDARDTIVSTKTAVQNIETFTEPLAENADEIIGQVVETLTSLDGALQQVEQFGMTLNNSDGTVKRLLEDDDLYYQIRRTVENIEGATARIRPILDDVRIFTDKIARDPRQLGVRGAITQRPSGTGIK